MTRASEDTLNNLHMTVAKVLTEQIYEEEPRAAMVSIAVKFLKDNDITCSIKDNQDMSILSDALKEKRAKRKLRIVGDE